MNSLPPELHQKVLRDLDKSRLKALRQVNKRYAALVNPLLFNTLQFIGPGYQSYLDIAHDDKDYPKRSVEFGRLHEAVPEVLPVASCATKLIFAPAFYREGFWDGYRASVTDMVSQPVEAHEIYEMSESIEDEDEGGDWETWYEGRIESVLAERRARLDNEAEMILKAEEEWGLKRQEQEEHKEKIEASLQQLIQGMPHLEDVDIRSWEFSGSRGLDFQSHSIDRYRNYTPIMHHLQVIADCLQKSGKYLEKLHVRDFMPKLVQDTPAIRHIFTGLRHLRLDINEVDSLREDSTFVHMLPAVLKQATSTLEHLEIICGGKWPQLPGRGVHLLGKILNDEETSAPISFPKLQSFRLVSLIVSTTSLIDFLAAQPQICNLEFGYVYLVTPSMGWESFALRLPKTVQTWKVSGVLGNEPIAGFEPPIAYNWCTQWSYKHDPLPLEAGWKGEPNGPAHTYFRRVDE